MSLSGFRYCICVFIYLSVAVAVSTLFGSFVAISATLCRCFKAMLCLSKFSSTGPKECSQNNCKKRRPAEGWSYTKHYCCVGLTGLKSENEKGSVEIRRHH